MADEIQRRMRLARMAELYYLERLTQSDIAARFGVSTMQVSRLLREAQQLGIIEFRIHHPLPLDLELARELKQRFGLEGVAAVRVTRPEQVKGDVARAAAQYLVSLLEPGSTLAVGWSSTLALMAQALPYRPIDRLAVVQMLGALPSLAEQSNPHDPFGVIGSQLGAAMHALHAPTVLRTRQARDALVADPAVAGVLDMARAAQFAICGIGTAGDDSTFFQMGYLTRAELDELRSKGVVGDLLGRFIDARGQMIPWSYADMLVSIGLDDFGQIPHSIAVAGGPGKAWPILAALRGGYLKHLVTDADTVRALLAIGDGQVTP